MIQKHYSERKQVLRKLMFEVQYYKKITTGTGLESKGWQC